MFRLVPFGPIVLLQQFSSGKLHSFSNDVANVTVDDDVPSQSRGEVRWGSEFRRPSIAELIDIQLCELIPTK